MVGGSGNREARFPSTSWSLIRRAGEESDDGSRIALADLLKRYLPALQTYLERKRVCRRDQIDDLLQAFIADKVLQCNLLASANREKGKFRSLLLSSLNNFVIARWRSDNAAKRGGGQTVSLESQPIEVGVSFDDAQKAFDQAWSSSVLAESIRRMCDECEATQRADIWGVFKARILDPIAQDVPPVSYDELVTRFGFETPRQATNVLITAKRTFVRILRSVVSEYSSSDQVDEEIRQLRQSLSGD